jgi:hypothetical protein
MTLRELWAAFHAAYDAHPYDVMHPCRVEARNQLWMAQHPEWIAQEYDCDCGF